MVARYRSVLSVPGFIRVFSTALIGRLPQGMTSLAILLLVRAHTGSYAAAGVAVGAYDFATAAGAPLLGRLVDRFGRARVLPPVAATQGLLLVALVLAAHRGAGAVILIVLSAAAGALMPPIAPSMRALLRDIVSDPEIRETAYTLESVVQELVWVTGPLLVAAVIAFAEPTAAVLLSSAICISGTALFVSSPAAHGRGTRAARQGRSPVLAIAELRALLGPIFLNGLALGAISVGLPALALHAGSRPATGLLLALWSVGSIAGGLWYGARTWRMPLPSRYRALLVAGVVCMTPLIAARTIPEGVVGAVLAGLCIAPVFSCQYALVGRAVPAGVETEAFTWVSSALIGGLAAGSALGGAAVAAGGVSAPFALGVAAMAMAALSAVRMRRTEHQLA
ncbi:MAG TPA: MFS transporter [Solirubrobacteraceae bacterium]|jgi:MFS family permease|nr:MFS transporter [Solirubrobacteraceae bacterium]